MKILTIEEHAVKSDGVTLDLILWRRFKTKTPGLLEYMLAMAENQGLEHSAAVLPLGTVVFVPIPAPKAQTVSNPVSLWS
jgi:phage tail protein X